MRIFFLFFLSKRWLPFEGISLLPRSTRRPMEKIERRRGLLCMAWLHCMGGFSSFVRSPLGGGGVPLFTLFSFPLLSHGSSFLLLPSFLPSLGEPPFFFQSPLPPSSFFLLPTAGEEETRFYSPPFLPFLSLSFFLGGEGDVNRVRFFSHECPAKLADEKRRGEGRKKASLILFSIVQINLRVPYTV